MVSRLIAKFECTDLIENTFRNPYKPSENTGDVELKVCLDIIEYKNMFQIEKALIERV